MPALTIGVTTARQPECKRGLATNLAASLGRVPALAGRVCVVDADPLARDVTTRLAVSGPFVDDVRPGPVDGEKPTPPARVWSCDLAAVGVRGDDAGALARVHLGARRLLPALRDSFDAVVCDLPAGRRDRGAPSAGGSSTSTGCSSR